MKIYCISGLGADKRAYQLLQLDHEMEHVNWVPPKKNEPLIEYCLRLGTAIDTNEPFGIMGLSFGGLVAVELTKFYNPVFTILLSSIETRKGLPLLFRLFGKTGIARLLPKKAFAIPSWIAIPVFQTKHKTLLKTILKETDLDFTKWAVNQILIWNNETKIENCLKISGSKDYLLPTSKQDDVIEIKGGGHLMVLENAKEVSNLINNWVKEFG